jgi:hypothetical protein
MSQHEHEFDTFLRRVLHEEANSIEPADDGLERIRARLGRPRPVPVAWVMAVFSGTGLRVQDAVRSVSGWLRTLPGATRDRRGPSEGGRARNWRSPVVLAAAATIVVVAGALALTPLPRQAVSGTASLFRSIGGSHTGGGGQGGQAEGSSGGQPGGAAPGSPGGKRSHRHPAAGASPSVAPSSAASSASPSPGTSASPTPTVSPSPTPTPSCASPSPSPSPGATTGPGTCPSPTPSTSPTGQPTSSPTPDPTPDP